MKITIDARALEWYQGTGMGTYTHNLLEGLKNANHHNYTLGFSKEKVPLGEPAKGTTLEGTRDFWERVYHHPLPKVDCDLLHNPFNGFGMEYQRDYPLVITLHDVIPLVLPKYCGSPYREHFQEEIEKIVANTDHIIAVSKRTKEDIITHLKVSPKKISVVYQGVEPIFRPLNREEVYGKLAKEYDITKDYILYVGGFGSRKNLPGLLRSFAQIKDEIPWNLVIVGRKGKTFSEAESLVKFLQIENRVIFAGFVPREDLPYFYRNAKIFVFPSLYEGFGLPPLEAASCGTPVLSSMAGSLKEVLQENALYFDPKKDDEISRGILELYRNREDRIALGRDGFQHSRNFSILGEARKTIAIYENLCR